jgi:hypothetical protein
MAQSFTSGKSECSSMHNSGTDVEAAPVSDADKTQLTQQKNDPNIVDWHGEDDPEMALNWPARRKWTYIIMLASLTLLTFVGHIFFLTVF